MFKFASFGLRCWRPRFLDSAPAMVKAVVTDENFNNQNPVWDPQGNYLYMFGQHEFAPLISNVEFNYALTKSTQIYALALRKDVKNPFPPESDEVTISKEEGDGANRHCRRPSYRP